MSRNSKTEVRTMLENIWVQTRGERVRNSPEVGTTHPTYWAT